MTSEPSGSLAAPRRRRARHAPGPPVDLAVTMGGAREGTLTADLAGQLRDALSDGRLSSGDRLPSSRALASALGVSRTVVTGAYAQLFAEGWVEGRHGSGTYVADFTPARRPADAPAGDRDWTGAWLEALDAAAPGARMDGQPPLIDLRPGVPWTAGIDRAAWRRAWRTAAAAPPAAASDAAAGAGLREALVGHLRRSRGVLAAPAQLVVTRGVAASLGLIASALLRPGEAVGVEEPGYPAARAVFAARGARVVPCRVDRDGLVVDELPGNLRLVYTTPAHQYPLGGRLPVARRQALVRWARARRALILEDDYDGEFRYDAAPLPPLFGIDNEVVIYLGTTSKTLTPALRVGWLAAAPSLATRLSEAAEALGDWPSEPAARAVLTLIAGGDLERHIRRARHEYTRRREAMVSALRDGEAGVLMGGGAGMHMVLATRADAARLAAGAWRRGVAVTTARRYYAGRPALDGLVLGYGAAGAEEVARACRVLRELSGKLGAAHHGTLSRSGERCRAVVREGRADPDT